MAETVRDHHKSPYGPIRHREQPYWHFARLAAKEGRVSRDGRVDPAIYSDIDRLLLEPSLEFMAGIPEVELDAVAKGEALAKLIAQRDWIPLAAQYELCGRQIFDINEKLSEMLERTDLGDCTLEDLHTPYDAFFVRFGKREALRLTFDSQAGTFEFVDGALVALAPWDDAGRKRIKVGFTMVHEDGSGVMYPGYFFDLLPDEMHLPVPEAIARALERRKESTTRGMEDAGFIADYIKAEVEYSADIFAQAASLLINALFYLESIRAELPELGPGRDVPPSRHAQWLQSPLAKRNKQRIALNSDGYALVRMVGREVEEVPAAPATGERATVRAHWRRGHWRFQRYGEARALRKRIWIKPMLVGGEGHDPAEQLAGHRYIVPASDAPH